MPYNAVPGSLARICGTRQACPHQASDKHDGIHSKSFFHNLTSNSLEQICKTDSSIENLYGCFSLSTVIVFEFIGNANL
jgi:hypothetical protein